MLRRCMMRKCAITTLVLFLLVSVLTSGVIAFAGAADLKARFKARLPVIMGLKAQGIVGENNKGYLEFVGGKRANPDVVAAENADRRKVYTAIAKKQGTSPDVVGNRRAVQIANKARPGDMLQNAGGKWHKK